MIGCIVVTKDGVTQDEQTLGTVSNVEDFGAAPLLIVEIDGREVMIPLADSICTEVDTAQKRIVVALPEGLLDL